MTEAYEAAYAKYQAAFQIFDQARIAYKNRKIDDPAFIAAKKNFDAAQAEMDEAEKATL